jgi:hypothetical protein
MSVEFDNNNNFNRSFNQSANVPGLTGWIIAKGWAKDEKTAKLYMVIFSLVCYAITGYLFFK